MLIYLILVLVVIFEKKAIEKSLIYEKNNI